MKQIVAIGNAKSVTKTSSSSSMKSSGPPSEAEKQAKRDLMVKAAKEREQQWDKRKKGGKNLGTDLPGRPIYDHSEAANLGNNNPETQRRVEAVRLAEKRQAEVSIIIITLNIIHYFISIGNGL
jgi:hypothetical protein